MDAGNDGGSRLWVSASWALVLTLGAYVVLALTGSWITIGELASQFRFSFGWGAAVVAVAIACTRAWRQAAFAAAIAIWGIWPEGSLAFRTPASAVAEGAPGTDLHVVFSNVLRPNTRYSEVFDVLLQNDPDVIGLLELSEEWRDAAFARLDENYPFHASASNTIGWNEHSWALMLFSKTEITSSEELRLDFDDWELRPLLQATLAKPIELTITLAHPERPGRSARMLARRTALERIAESKVAGNWLVIGDLNSTSTSPLFQKIVRQTGLRDSRVGFGRQPSWSFGDQLPGPWPIPLPSFARLGVAIDHALISDRLGVLDRRTLFVPGSDHRAVSVKLRAAAGDRKRHIIKLQPISGGEGDERSRFR